MPFFPTNTHSFSQTKYPKKYTGKYTETKLLFDFQKKSRKIKCKMKI